MRTHFRTLLPRLAVIGLFSLMTACSGENGRMVYVPLEPENNSRLPLAPHVELIRARPTAEMIQSHQGRPMRFRLLDKRTLQTKLMDLTIGQPQPGPWGGWVHAVSYVPDLLLREGSAVHGPEGHVNPAVWTVINDAEGVPLHESWMFSRDTAQTAWDHPHYDISFVGPVVPPPVVETQTEKSKKGGGRAKAPPVEEDLITGSD